MPMTKALRLSALLGICLSPATSLLAQEEEPEKPSGWQKPAPIEIFSERSYDREGMRAAPRDAFPVLNHPEMSPAVAGSLEIDEEEPVIGLFVGGEARAYPISVMGGVELVNDTCGEIPVAVSW